MRIIRYEQVEAVGYADAAAKGVTGRVMIGKADGANHYCMRVFEVAPGGYTPKHSHDWEHEVFVHAGRGAVYNQGDWVPLEKGSAVFVPPNEEHQFKNSGDTPFLFVCVIPSGVPEI
jgi:quercetin dioxygenase-like cupin family protein